MYAIVFVIHIYQLWMPLCVWSNDTAPKYCVEANGTLFSITEAENKVFEFHRLKKVKL